MDKDIIRGNAMLNTAIQQRDAANNIIAELTGDIAVLNSEIAALQEQLAEKDAEISKLMSEDTEE